MEALDAAKISPSDLAYMSRQIFDSLGHDFSTFSDRQVAFAPELGKWNHLVKPAN